MKIEYEIPGVRVLRYRTITEAFRAYLGKEYRPKSGPAASNILHLYGPAEGGFGLNEMLHEPLLKGFDGGEAAYERTLALVSIDREIGVSEFLRELAKRGFSPATMSESVHYLLMLKARLPDAEAETVLHLGTVLQDEKCEEQRLLTTRGKGGIELVPFYPTTKLKTFYKIVAAREEKAAKK